MKLAIVTTHPIQYNAPWFLLLSQQPEVTVKVFYTWEQSADKPKFDPGFGKIIEWDVPLLDGYDYTFVKNESKDPGSHHYKGIVTPTLNKEIEDWGAQAVLVVGWPFKSHLNCMRYFKGKIPVIFRGDSTLLDEKNGARKILRRSLLRYVYSHIDYAMYVGTNNKAYFRANGLTENQLFFVPHAIDNKRFEDTSGNYREEAVAWRKELGIGKDDFVVLFAGKFNTKKNPRLMIQLANMIKDENFRFILVGNGELEAELKESVTDDRIIFLDFQNQLRMPVVYQLCDVFILPSRGPNETWGLVLNEAIASGKYVVSTTQVGASIDLIENYVNGIVVEPDDVKTVVTSLLDMYLGNKYSTDTMHKKNTALLQVYSFENIVKNFIDFLSSEAFKQKIRGV